MAAQLKFRKDALIFLRDLIKIIQKLLLVNIICSKIGFRTATSSFLVKICRKIYSVARNFAHIYFARLSIKDR